MSTIYIDQRYYNKKIFKVGEKFDHGFSWDNELRTYSTHKIILSQDGIILEISKINEKDIKLFFEDESTKKQVFILDRYTKPHFKDYFREKYEFDFEKMYGEYVWNIEKNTWELKITNDKYKSCEKLLKLIKKEDFTFKGKLVDKDIIDIIKSFSYILESTLKEKGNNKKLFYIEKLFIEMVYSFKISMNQIMKIFMKIAIDDDNENGLEEDEKYDEDMEIIGIVKKEVEEREKQIISNKIGNYHEKYFPEEETLYISKKSPKFILDYLKKFYGISDEGEYKIKLVNKTYIILRE